MNITQNIVSERDRALLGGDYASYHSQATRKIHGLRRRLGTATPRGRKYTSKPSVTAENVSQNVQWVQLLLVTAERAWADAMAMKSSQSPENTQRPMPGSTKKQIVSRHRRAIAHATNLVDVLSDPASQSTEIDLLEAKAYLSLLKGGLDFEKSRWASCIQNYAIARLIYVALDKTTKTDIFKDLLSGTIDPSIKYAAYQSKLPRTKAVGDVAVESFPASESATKAKIQEVDPQAFQSASEKTVSTRSDAPTNLPTTITWRSRNVKIEDASVSQALGLAQDKEAALVDILSAFRHGSASARQVAAAYEEVIDARQEAVDVTKSVIDELRSQGVEQGDTRIQSLQVTRTAVNYAVIEWRIGRNRILCGQDDGLTFASEQQKQNPKLRKDGKPRVAKEESSGRKLGRLRERVALYDSILQSLDAIKELPGVAADTQLVREIGDKKTYFKALKCLAIGRSHALDGHTDNALALFSHANDLIQQSSIEPGSTDESTDSPTKLEIASGQLKSARKHIASLATQYRALAELKNSNNSTKSKDGSQGPPLIEQLHLKQYSSDLDPKNLVNYPPRLQPVPVKPLFFDLAWNYIQYPGQQQTMTEPVLENAPEAKQEAKPAKKGWFGFGR